MDIEFLAADSLGLRSMATYIETKDLRILIDPGASVAPIRNGFGPTQEELNLLEKTLAKIKAYIRISDLIIISHYHYDHYIYFEPSVFNGKRLFLKNPEKI